MNTRGWIKRLSRIVGAVLIVAVLVTLAYVVLHYDPAPLSAERVTELVDRLNEGAAVQVPHFSLDDGKTRRQHVELFRLVEQGQPLSEQQSARYRLIYQDLLRRHQARLGRFDDELTVLPDLGMQIRNNVGGTGIAGAHDHHDRSARSNYEGLRTALQATAEAGGARAVRHAIVAYKDLRDILLHLATAPHTKSITHQGPAIPPRDTLDRLFEDVLREFKLAQFQPVNSPGFHQHVINALNRYDGLVLAVQEVIHERLSPVERTLAGTWQGWQSLSPNVEEFEPTRISRAPHSTSGSIRNPTYGERYAR